MADVLGGLEGISAPSINWAQILGIVQIVMIGAILIGLTYFIIKYLKYNIKIIIEERHEYGTFVKFKRAKIGYDKNDKDRTVEQIYLLFERTGYPIMPSSSVYQELIENSKTGELAEGWYKSCYGLTNRGKKVLRVVKEGNEYTIIPFTNDNVLPYLRISKPVRMQWANNMLRQGIELYKGEPSFMEKYGSYVILGGTLIVVLLIMIFMFEKLDNINAYAQGLADFAAATREHAEALKAFGQQTIQ